MTMSDSAAFDYDTVPLGYYDEIFHRRRGVQSKWHHLKFLRVRESIDTAVRHLDIGCGPGTFIGTLPDGVQSTGVDIAEPQLIYAREHYAASHRQFVHIAEDHLPFADASFDCVTVIELIEHLTAGQAAALISEVHRVLSPGGRVVVTTPNYRSPWPFVEFLVNRLGKVDYSEQHINRYTKGRLRQLLMLAGFQKPEVSAYQFMAPFVAFIGWRAADLVNALEPRWLTSRLGLLLLGLAVK